MKTVFLDSSVFFSAVNSPTGGSAKLFTIGNIQLVASPVVLAEVERNVRTKLQSYHLERFFVLTDRIRILKQLPDKSLIQKAKKVIVAKDAVILAEVKRAKTDYLVTLNIYPSYSGLQPEGAAKRIRGVYAGTNQSCFSIKHFFTSKVVAFLKGKKIVTPKMLIGEMEKAVSF